MLEKFCRNKTAIGSGPTSVRLAIASILMREHSDEIYPLWDAVEAVPLTEENGFYIDEHGCLCWRGIVE